MMPRIAGHISYGWRLAVIFLLLTILVLPGLPVTAQSDQPEGPVYIVQEGDNLWDIAQRFGVSVDDLTQVNHITDPSRIKAGDRLVIPGLPGVQGVLDAQIVPFGENLRSLSRRYDVPVKMLARLNHLVNPQEIYAGMPLIIPQQETPYAFGQRATLVEGQSLLELAVLKNSDPWTLVATNELSGTWAALPGDVLRAPGAADNGPGALPPVVTALEISSSPFIQGQTGVITVTSATSLTLDGSFTGYDLHFFPYASEKYIALQGIYAMIEPGLYPMQITGTLKSGAAFGFTQLIHIEAGDFLVDPPIQVDPKTIDPAITGPENELWASTSAPATPTKMWQSYFVFPTPKPFWGCYTSWFGDRRSFNDSAYIYFHTGIDFCTGSGTEIYAAAPGKVVFASYLVVRGCAIMIDHGWGVYTAYEHLQEENDQTHECYGFGIKVKPGDQVEAGQLIGISGGTGRVDGPHLHWEIIVGGVQVQPLDWLERIYP